MRLILLNGSLWRGCGHGLATYNGSLVLHGCGSSLLGSCIVSIGSCTVLHGSLLRGGYSCIVFCVCLL